MCVDKVNSNLSFGIGVSISHLSRLSENSAPNLCIGGFCHIHTQIHMHTLLLGIMSVYALGRNSIMLQLSMHTLSV